jgi:capsular exopolysaccharide synthesis family protein
MNDISADEPLAGGNPEINMRKYLIKLIRRWPYILSFFLVSILIGYSFNRYFTPVYAIKGRITTSKFSNKSSSIVPGLVDADFFLSGLTEVYEEIPILKSPKRIEATIDKLDLRVSYFAQGTVKTMELSQGFGFDVEVDSISEKVYPYSLPIFVNRISDTKFELNIENEEWKKRIANKQFTFGQPFSLGTAQLRIKNTNGKGTDRDKYYFILNRKEDLIDSYRNRLQISWAMKGSAMLDLYMQSKLPDQDLKFMNAYYQVVQEIGLAEKNETLDNTIKFIDEQMKMVTDSLNYYQTIIDGMKLDNHRLLDGADQIYTKINELDKKKAEIILNERYLDYLSDYFTDKSDAEVFAPSLVGLSIPPMEAWVNQYINLKLNEKNFRNIENAQNPLVNREDSLRRRLVKGIFESMDSERKRDRDLLAELNKQENQLYTSINEVQRGSRNLTRLERLYQINNTLFDLFIKRRTEAAISKASATSDYKVIDQPSFSRVPIKPDKKGNLVIAAALGLILPVGFLLFRDITNNKIMDKDDLQAILHIPWLGNVAHSRYNTHLVMGNHPRSVVAESFRAIRANLKFLAGNVTTKARTFLITSSVGGEGKTFCSLNLAYTLALSQKKTIIIGADLRKPELATYLNLTADQGLSTYLAGYATIEQVIIKGEANEPDLIDAGKVPPNPSELLTSDRMSELIAFLKQRYDYIIIDTSPIGLVSDAFELFKFSDYNILIVRQGITPKGALKMVNELYLEGKLKNFTVLFNDVQLIQKRGSYYGNYLYGMGYSGYGFGYYEEDEKK